MIIDNSNYRKYMSSDIIMDCNHSNITEIRYLPDSLETLYCYSNHITSLPDLPDSLVILYCEDNQLTSLPELPDGLVKLDCDNNQLTSLPELPADLKRLYCYGNRLPIDGRFYNKEAINEFKIKLDKIIKLEKFLLP